MPTEHPVEFVWQLNLTDTGRGFNSDRARELAHALLHGQNPLCTQEWLDRIVACFPADMPLLKFASPFTEEGRRLHSAVTAFRAQVYSLRDAEAAQRTHERVAACLEACRRIEETLRNMYPDFKYNRWDRKILNAPRDAIMNFVGDYPNFRLFASPLERIRVLEAFVHRAGLPDMHYGDDRPFWTMRRVSEIATGTGPEAGRPRREIYHFMTDFDNDLVRYILLADIQAARPELAIRLELARRRQLIHAAGLGRLRVASPLARLDRDLLAKILRLALAL